MKRQATTLLRHGLSPERVREVGLTLDAIADTMLEQLAEGAHVNPRIEYARALGGRIRSEMGAGPLVHRVTHAIMTGNLDRVTQHDAQALVRALERRGHNHTAGQLATFFDRYHR